MPCLKCPRLLRWAAIAPGCCSAPQLPVAVKRLTVSRVNDLAHPGPRCVLLLPLLSRSRRMRTAIVCTSSWSCVQGASCSPALWSQVTWDGWNRGTQRRQGDWDD